MNILIVEDDENSRVLQDVYLSADGHSVTSAKDGEIAILQLLQHTPDMIISDILMPVMDGFEFCRWVKNHPQYKDIPFVFYTATYVESKDEQLAYALGAQLFLIKPLEPLEFIKRIKGVVKDTSLGKLTPVSIDENESITQQEYIKFYNSRIRKKLDKKTLELNSEQEVSQQHEKNYQRLVESLDVGVLELDLKLFILNANKAWHKLLGAALVKLETNMSFTQLFSTENALILQSECAKIIAQSQFNSTQTMQLKMLGIEHDVLWLNLRLSAVMENNHVIGFSAIIYNITASLIDRQKIERYSSIFNHTSHGILVLDHNGKVVEVNPGFLALTGLPIEPFLGRDFTKLNSIKFTKEQRASLRLYIKAGKPWQGEVVHIHLNGISRISLLSLFVLPSQMVELQQLVCFFTDISDIKSYQDQLLYLTRHDKNTGLYNRLHFVTLLDYELKRCARDGRQLAVCFLDVDNFKDINDTFGHAIGDEFIALLATNLKNKLRQTDVIARFGGDEFIIFFEIEAEQQSAEQSITNIRQLVSGEFITSQAVINASVSLGIAIYPNDGLTSAELIKNADTAMYHAKKQGVGSFAYYRQALTEQVVRRISIVEDIKQALLLNQFEMWYQPQIDVITEEISGAEALIRWQHPTKGLINPIDFIPLAEELGLIAEVDRWVMNSVFNQVFKWHEKKLFFGRVALNVSTKTFKQSKFRQHYAEAISQYQIDPSHIEIEITEGAFSDEEDISPFLQELQSLGYGIAIDDFGTGYSSLSRLRSIPVNRLKIDRSFIDPITDSLAAKALVKSIINLAHSLDLCVIAEGIETQQHLTILKELGCNHMQGYYISRPLPVALFEMFVQSYCPNPTGT
ncbi:GGDEF domain [Shewanella denitrificans OS217]|uniref:GGDEF domain n=1 Tax=Shewanella denitrificans (strain OS217 / ATCC BAA-1090 / DSM 15013) TaxID=318161 RepID=Q12MP7_SHEDO|nr:EAL domain-containing protein [Shewanella denitrificans]ABE55279.1 GGDEF domain [Shewanella denitrificans OS217]